MHKHDQKQCLPSLLLSVLQPGPSIELEVYDVPVLNRVVSALLPVLACSLKSQAPVDTTVSELLIT
jgi:hypothetical protein